MSKPSSNTLRDTFNSLFEKVEIGAKNVKLTVENKQLEKRVKDLEGRLEAVEREMIYRTNWIRKVVEEELQRRGGRTMSRYEEEERRCRYEGNSIYEDYLRGKDYKQIIKELPKL